jgi:hypothetical protein
VNLFDSMADLVEAEGNGVGDTTAVPSKLCVTGAWSAWLSRAM